MPIDLRWNLMQYLPRRQDKQRKKAKRLYLRLSNIGENILIKPWIHTNNLLIAKFPIWIGGVTSDQLALLGAEIIQVKMTTNTPPRKSPFDSSHAGNWSYWWQRRELHQQQILLWVWQKTQPHICCLPCRVEQESNQEKYETENPIAYNLIAQTYSLRSPIWCIPWRVTLLGNSTYSWCACRERKGIGLGRRIVDAITMRKNVRDLQFKSRGRLTLKRRQNPERKCSRWEEIGVGRWDVCWSLEFRYLDNILLAYIARKKSAYRTFKCPSMCHIKIYKVWIFNRMM